MKKPVKKKSKPKYKAVTKKKYAVHPGGRPTKYTPKVNELLNDYLATTGREQTSLPTIEGFAIFLDVSRECLYEWAKKYEEFSYTLKELELRQKQQLINDGIYGGKEVNSTIVKLLLQNNHGMREKVDTTTDGKPLPIQVVSYKDL